MRRFLTAAVGVFVLSSNLQGQDSPRVDRYWGQFQIGRVQMTAEPFDGGAGSGLKTDWAPIFAQAVVRIEEAQNFTWEWIGISAPGTMSLKGFPNITFEGFSDERIEYSELGMDLNPVAPNVWGSREIIALPYRAIHVAGTYKSFNTQKNFETDFSGSLSFGTAVTHVNYESFPGQLTATVSPRVNTYIYDFGPAPGVVLEPKLRIGDLAVRHFDFNTSFTLKHTPTGDANNDGRVSFDDFLILSRGFGIAQAAKWEDGDFDEDGAVGFSDFLGLSRNFGLGALTVPEPASWAMLLASMALLSLMRRTRCRELVLER